jgi:hypothetical protein
MNDNAQLRRVFRTGGANVSGQCDGIEVNAQNRRDGKRCSHDSFLSKMRQKGA